MHHYVYLVNRFNLKESTDEMIRRLKEVSDEYGRDYEIIVNETPEEAGAVMSRFQDTEYIITAIGGDGSINRLLNDLVGTKNILAFIPAGTGNDFARTCMNDMEDGIHDIDLIRVNDRYCVNVVCFGIDADIANDDTFIHNRFIPRKMRFNAGVLYHFLNHKKGRPLRVQYDGRIEKRRFTTIIAANSQYYGCGYNVSPESRLDDGTMEVFLVRNLRRLKIAMLILSMKNAGHLKNPSVKILKTKKISITAATEFKANIDGEPLQGRHFELEMVPRALRIDFNREFIERVRM